MALPEPERGLVISYSYLWSHEAAEGAEEGRKNRPCVIVAGVKRVNDEIIVTVFPITHQAPNDLKCAVEIPAKVKEHLGLDADRSWVMVDEANRFVWPGYDLRKVPGTDRYDYGFLPPGLFESVLAKGREWLKLHGLDVTQR